MLEVKRTLDGTIVEYPVERLLVEPGVRAVLLHRIDRPTAVADARITLPAGTLSVGYFWCSRPYNLYHWLHGGETLLHYVNIGRVVTLTADAVAWDDHAVDVLVHRDGTIDVVDTDEIPAAADAALRASIAAATASVVEGLDAIVAAAERESRVYLGRVKLTRAVR